VETLIDARVSVRHPMLRGLVARMANSLGFLLSE